MILYELIKREFSRSIIRTDGILFSDDMAFRIKQLTGWRLCDAYGALMCLEPMEIRDGDGYVTENFFHDYTDREIIRRLKSCGYL